MFRSLCDLLFPYVSCYIYIYVGHLCKAEDVMLDFFPVKSMLLECGKYVIVLLDKNKTTHISEK